MTIIPSGNVGIGKTDPGHKLHVEGTVNIVGTLGVTGATTLSSTLGVTGATTLSSTLGVTGATTLSNTLTTTGNLYINNDSPTIYFQDTNNKSAMIHVNSDVFYILNGSGNNSTTWSSPPNSRWPMELNMSDGNMKVSGLIQEAGSWLSDKYQAKGSYQAAGSYAAASHTHNYADVRGSSDNKFVAKLFNLTGGWWISQANYLKDDGEGPNINAYSWQGSGADAMAGEDLVFTRNSDASTVWIRKGGDVNLNAINMTGQHGLHSLNKELKESVGYIACVSSEGYWDENQKYFYKNKKRYIDINECLPMIRLSNKKKEKSVIGVISNKRQDFNVTPLRSINTYKEKAIVVNSIGEGAIWVSNFNGNIENGDYITSSDIPGIGMRQDDDILHNYTVAKITMDCDFEPKWIPVMKTSTYTSNVLSLDGSNLIAKEFFNYDSNNNYIYEQELDTNNNLLFEWEYDMRYIRLNGTIIDKNVYDIELSSNLQVFKMAFVGCTYHSG
jgi:hypothetical protein